MATARVLFVGGVGGGGVVCGNGVLKFRRVFVIRFVVVCVVFRIVTSLR